MGRQTKNEEEILSDDIADKEGEEYSEEMKADALEDNRELDEDVLNVIGDIKSHNVRISSSEKGTSTTYQSKGRRFTQAEKDADVVIMNRSDDADAYRVVDPVDSHYTLPTPSTHTAQSEERTLGKLKEKARKKIREGFAISEAKRAEKLKLEGPARKAKQESIEQENAEKSLKKLAEEGMRKKEVTSGLRDMRESRKRAGTFEKIFGQKNTDKKREKNAQKAWAKKERAFEKEQSLKEGGYAGHGIKKAYAIGKSALTVAKKSALSVAKKSGVLQPASKKYASTVKAQRNKMYPRQRPLKRQSRKLAGIRAQSRTYIGQPRAVDSDSLGFAVQPVQQFETPTARPSVGRRQPKWTDTKRVRPATHRSGLGTYSPRKAISSSGMFGSSPAQQMKPLGGKYNSFSTMKTKSHSFGGNMVKKKPKEDYWNIKLKKGKKKYGGII